MHFDWPAKAYNYEGVILVVYFASFCFWEFIVCKLTVICTIELVYTCAGCSSPAKVACISVESLQQKRG